MLQRSLHRTLQSLPDVRQRVVRRYVRRFGGNCDLLRSRCRGPLPALFRLRTLRPRIGFVRLHMSRWSDLLRGIVYPRVRRV